MKYLSWAKFLIMTIALFLTSHACMGQESFEWEGEYLYQDQLGKSFGGSPIVIDMNLRIKADGSCSLVVNGYQISEKIICRAVSDSVGKQIAFVSYDNGKIENEYGVQQYQVDEVLFSLERSQDKVLTTWQSLKPDNIEKTKGSFFVKAKMVK
jgi:hypothetical protein